MLFIISPDASIIYFFLWYNTGNSRLFFNTFSTSTGSAIGSRYVSNDDTYYVHNSAISNDYVIK